MVKFITAIERCYFIIYHHKVFVTESTTSKNDLLKLGIKEDKIVMIPPGVDQKLFHPAAKSKYPSLVYFGGMRKYKRPLEVLYLLKSLLDKLESLKLFIIGTGPEEQGMKRLVNELNMQDCVEFTGRISNKELSDIVASSWLNVHTSVTEGWGFSILESSAAGTPTVAYDVPGVRDAVEDGLNGIKVKDGDRKALADAALSILNNPGRWWSSSIEVAKKYSWDKTAELWEELINKMYSE
jgi:glycosyltransferase involved in cell wall biosynthesis